MLLLALLCGAGVPADAGEVSGVAKLSTGGYRQESGSYDSRVGSLAQQLYVKYQDKGVFYKKRGGYWNLDVGYEWTWLDVERDAVSKQLENNRLLYSGELMFAPGGLPFRLTAYARDSRNTALSQGTTMQLVDSKDGAWSNYGLVDDLFGGSRKELGVTLLAGIRNGSYLGSYRDLLSQLPMLVIDYSQVRVSDLIAIDKSNYLDRNIAFISLNKKDNWVHYRLRLFEDYIDPSKNFSNTTVTLGTIDAEMKRRWINLTNWIQISADLNLYFDEMSVGQDVEKYDLNTIVKGKVDRLSFLIPFNYQRRNVANELSGVRTVDSSASLPVFLNGKTAGNGAWRASVIYQGSSDQDYLVNALIDENTRGEVSANASYEKPLGEYHKITVGADVDNYREHDNAALAVRGTLRLNKPRRGRDDVDYSFFATLAAQNGTSEVVGNLGYRETTFDGDLSFPVGERMRFGLMQTMALGEGGLDQKLSTRIAFRGVGSLRTSSYQEELNTSVVQYTSKVFSEYLAPAGFESRLELAANVHEAEETSRTYELSHRGNYRHDNLQFSITNTLTSGDDLGFVSAFSGEGSEITRTGTEKRSLSSTHTLSLDYAPTRAFLTQNQLRYVSTSSAGPRVSQLEFKESLQYAIFTTNGVVRKKYEFAQRAIYRDESTGSADYEDLDLYFSLRYYPYKFLGLFSNYARRFALDDIDTYRELYQAGAKITFTKLEVDFSYSGGERTGEMLGYSASTSGLKEQLWTLNVKKTF